MSECMAALSTVQRLSMIPGLPLALSNINTHN